MTVRGGFLGLIRAMLERRGISYRKNLHHDASGKVLGLDAGGWLHKLTSACAKDVVFLDDAGRYTKVAELFAAWCMALRQAGVNLRVVFDGDSASMPGKKQEKADRAVAAADALEAVRAAGESADFSTAPLKSTLAQAASGMCGEAMVTAVRHELAWHGIGCTVAPYEADSQLVQMERKGIIYGVLTPDADMIVHGCKYTFIMPAAGTGDRFTPMTGAWVHRFDLDSLISDVDSVPIVDAALAAGDTRLATTDQWLGACLSKHAQATLPVLAAIAGCDYSGTGIPNVGLVTALPVLYKHGPTDIGLLVRHLQPQPRSQQVACRTRSKRGTAATQLPPADPALLTLVSNAVDCYAHALAFDLMSQQMVEISGRLTTEQLKDKETLVGHVHDGVRAKRIFMGACSALAPAFSDLPQLNMTTVWQDDEIVDRRITADMVDGAQLLPESFERDDYSTLDDGERSGAQALGLDAKTWPQRFDGRFKTLQKWSEDKRRVYLASNCLMSSCSPSTSTVSLSSVTCATTAAAAWRIFDCNWSLRPLSGAALARALIDDRKAPSRPASARDSEDKRRACRGVCCEACCTSSAAVICACGRSGTTHSV